MKNRLKTAIAKAIVDGISNFGKAVLLAGALAIVAYVIKIPIALDIGALNALQLIFIGFSANVLSNLFKQ